MKGRVAFTLVLIVACLVPGGQALGKSSRPAPFNATPRAGEVWLYNEYWTLADVECIGVGGAVLPGRFLKLPFVARETRAITQALMLRPTGYRKFPIRYVWRYS